MSDNKENVATVTEGNLVSVHYRGTHENGEVFDSSYDRGTPIEFTVGAAQMIPGFESNVVGMLVGEKKNFTINPDQAYGERDPNAIKEVPRATFPEGYPVAVGEMVQGEAGGQPVRATVVSLQEDTVTLDFNHPMAGKTLTFDVEVVSTAAKE